MFCGSNKMVYLIWKRKFVDCPFLVEHIEIMLVQFDNNNNSEKWNWTVNYDKF